MSNNGNGKKVDWKDWSTETFDEARSVNRLVLLDLTASWCHWCHVMDQTTYSNPDIAEMINENFVAVRVDIDKRPDISERYNRGGFPTTAFLSDQGEPIWGSTYVPPADLKKIIGSILQAKRSGEIDQALDRSRMHYLDLAKALEPKDPVGHAELDILFEDIFASYDVEHGGFGFEPKFPHPEVIELLLAKYAEERDEQILAAVSHTLESMAQGLYDKVGGGLFRYSVTKDWRSPHYEKMLETNLGYLKNLTFAYALSGRKEFGDSARGTALYIIRTLRDSDEGGFYGSQDADEEYYNLSEVQRAGRKTPSVDKTIYAGWNAQAVTAMIQAGSVLQERTLTDAGVGAWNNLLAKHWNMDRGLIRHLEHSEIYLFEDQANLLGALVSMMSVQTSDSLVQIAERLIVGVEEGFKSEDGGYNDVLQVDGAIGELGNPRRPLVENSNWANSLARYGAAMHRYDLIEKAKQILDSFARKELDSYGMFGAAYLLARRTVELGPIVFEVHTISNDAAVTRDHVVPANAMADPAAVIIKIFDDAASGPFAIVCSKDKCLEKTSDTDSLSKAFASLIESSDG